MRWNFRKVERFSWNRCVQQKLTIWPKSCSSHHVCSCQSSDFVPKPIRVLLIYLSIYVGKSLWAITTLWENIKRRRKSVMPQYLIPRSKILRSLKTKINLKKYIAFISIQVVGEIIRGDILTIFMTLCFADFYFTLNLMDYVLVQFCTGGGGLRSDPSPFFHMTTIAYKRT